jgi:rRNA maturation protein Nop10
MSRTGINPVMNMKTCPRCGGLGHISGAVRQIGEETTVLNDPDLPGPMVVRRPVYGNRETCPSCRGEGKVWRLPSEYGNSSSKDSPGDVIFMLVVILAALGSFVAFFWWFCRMLYGG